MAWLPGLEGAETERQRATLLELGCEMAQGFLWATAIPPERFASMLEASPTPN